MFCFPLKCPTRVYHDAPGVLRALHRELCKFLRQRVAIPPDSCTIAAMTNEATQLMAEVLKRVKLNSGFSPIDIGAKIGLNKLQCEAAARALSNAGIFVLGFDMSAHFSPDFRKARAKTDLAAAGKKKKTATAARRARTAEPVLS
ncbi:MAG: hypothetical protein JWP03_504 [Phycisphaerales bacterium]|nr:hypothetical protein [Phycisphaerales bacterium]